MLGRFGRPVWCPDPLEYLPPWHLRLLVLRPTDVCPPLGPGDVAIRDGLDDRQRGAELLRGIARCGLLIAGRADPTVAEVTSVACELALPTEIARHCADAEEAGRLQRFATLDMLCFQVHRRKVLPKSLDRLTRL